MDLDYSVYPDLDRNDLPADLVTPEEQADYIHRICSAWDFYAFAPEPATFRQFARWRKASSAFLSPSPPPIAPSAISWAFGL